MITNTTPFVNIPNYPDAEALDRELKALPHVVALDCDAIAKSRRLAARRQHGAAGRRRPFLGLTVEQLEQGIRDIFSRKGEAVVASNLAAFRAGYEQANRQTK